MTSFKKVESFLKMPNKAMKTTMSWMTSTILVHGLHRKEDASELSVNTRFNKIKIIDVCFMVIGKNLVMVGS